MQLAQQGPQGQQVQQVQQALQAPQVELDQQVPVQLLLDQLDILDQLVPQDLQVHKGLQDLEAQLLDPQVIRGHQVLLVPQVQQDLQVQLDLKAADLQVQVVPQV